MSVPNSPGRSSGTSSQAGILRFISGFMASQALYVITKLGIPDLLKDGPKDSKELAQATGTHADWLNRVLRAVASVGVVAQDGTGRFALTSLGLPLQTGVPGSLRAWALVTLGGEHYQAWGDLIHSRIIHDWDDKRAGTILRNSGQARDRGQIQPVLPGPRAGSRSPLASRSALGHIRDLITPRIRGKRLSLRVSGSWATVRCPYLLSASIPEFANEDRSSLSHFLDRYVVRPPAMRAFQLVDSFKVRGLRPWFPRSVLRQEF